MILGITGGLGCGKSTAARMFEQRGFKRIDSDALVREQVLTSPDVITEVRGRYGAEVLGGDGALDRAALAARVFADEGELRWLESLIHPRVFALWRAAFGAEPSAR